MAKRGGNPQNLKPFKKGRDDRRNTKGPAYKLPEIDVILAKVLGSEQNDQTMAEAIVISLANTALKGRGAEKNRAAEILMNRGWGMPKQKSEVENTGVVTINFIPDGNKHSDKKPT